MIEELATPITIETPWGVNTITHQSYRFDINIPEKQIFCHILYGKIDSEGDFILFQPQELIPVVREVVLGKSVLKKLLEPNDKGKKKNVFRTDDLIDKVKEKVTEEEIDKTRQGNET